MTVKSKDIKARLTEKDYMKLVYMEQMFKATRSDIMRVALENLLCKNVFIEEFSFCDVGYDFKQFEGVKNIISKKGFSVMFWNDEDFRFKGNIAYEIYIPFRYLKEHTGLSSYEEYYELSHENKITKKDFNIDNFHDFISDIRAEVEEEIFNYLENNDLVEEMDFN